jgi:hypothetical protein
VLALVVRLLSEFTLRPLQFFRAAAKALMFGVLPFWKTFHGFSDLRGRFGISPVWTVANRLEHSKDARVCLGIGSFQKLKSSEQVLNG